VRVASGLDDIPRTMPAMLEAGKLGSRASKVGFDWPSADGLFAKLQEEIAELKVELAEANASAATQESINEELGDLLFTAINLARHVRVDPESALRAANAKFRARFRAMEAISGGYDALASLAPAELDALWNQAKRDGDASAVGLAGSKSESVASDGLKP
jgi:ATP diphosphatase